MQLTFLNKLILSTYQHSLNFEIPKEVEVVFNELLPNRGTTNRNQQILTSRAGINQSTSKYCVKMRTCQIFEPESIQKMYDFWIKEENPEKAIPIPKKPLGKIYVGGLYRDYPYHPRDHIFWGFTEDLKILFDIPFDLSENHSWDYSYKTRSETYIAQFYYAKYFPDIQEHIDNPEIFLGDCSPRVSEALARDMEVKDSLFKSFPRVDFNWPKHGLSSYHWDVAVGMSEYWSE